MKKVSADLIKQVADSIIESESPWVCVDCGVRISGEAADRGCCDKCKAKRDAGPKEPKKEFPKTPPSLGDVLKRKK
jgi:hypothetical protein